MEKQFPRAGEWEPGGETMIVICFRSYAASQCESAVLRNPLPYLKIGQRNKVLTPTVGWYRSARRKNSPKRSPIRLPPGRINSIRIRPQNGSTVTTTHVFRPNQRRQAVSLLPIWLRNSHSIGCRHIRKLRERGGGAVERSRQDHLNP